MSTIICWVRAISHHILERNIVFSDRACSCCRLKTAVFAPFFAKINSFYMKWDRNHLLKLIELELILYELEMFIEIKCFFLIILTVQISQKLATTEYWKCSRMLGKKNSSLRATLYSQNSCFRSNWFFFFLPCGFKFAYLLTFLNAMRKKENHHRCWMLC